MLTAALTLTLLSPAAGASSATAADFAWSGGAPVGQPNWSNPANWAGTAPGNPVGTLSFPILSGASCTATTPTASCYTSTNDITGLAVNALAVDDGAPYDITGNAITLGAGGLTASTTAAGPQMFFGATLGMPIALSAPQTWSIDGNNVGYGLDLSGNITGPSDALTINISNQGALGLGSDVEVGPVTIGGVPSGTGVSLGSKLNATDGNAVSIAGGLLDASNDSAVGPLTSTGGLLVVGAGGPGPTGDPTLSVNGGVTLDATSGLGMNIDLPGTAVGTHSQLSASGAVALAGHLYLTGAGGAGALCATLHPGDVDTLITTPGSLTGTFTGIPDGTTVPVSCLDGVSGGPTVRINYTAHTVTATVLTAGASAPSNSSPPTIAGTATQGQALTETNGAWTNSPTSFGYQWQDCDGAGNNCAPIAGATGQTYTLTASDVGHTITVQETASNAAGSSSPASSGHTAVVLPLAPSNASLPMIAGTTTQGQTLTESHGSWSNSPASFAYQWQDCDGAGNNCVAITGATGQTYVLAATDVSHTIRVQESATNAGGTGGPVASAATAAVQAPAATPIAPASTGAPPISGSPAVGVTLGCGTGFWSGTTPQTYSYQWLRDATAIAGATGANYTITAADAGHALSCRVTAGNSAGSASAQSASVNVPANTSTVGVASVGHASVKGTTATVRVGCKGVTGQACTVTLKLTVRETLKAGKLIALSTSRRTLVVGETTVTLSSGQSKTVHVKLNMAGRSLLASRHKLSAKLGASQTTSNGSRGVGGARTVTFKVVAKTKKKG